MKIIPFLFLLIFSLPATAARVDLSGFTKEDFFSIAGISIGDDCDDILEKHAVVNPDAKRSFSIKLPKLEGKRKREKLKFDCYTSSWEVQSVRLSDVIGWNMYNEDTGKYRVSSAPYPITKEFLAMDKKFSLLKKKVRVHQFNRLFGVDGQVKEPHPSSLADTRQERWRYRLEEDEKTIYIYTSDGKFVGWSVD